MADLVHEIIFKSANRFPDAEALVYRRSRISYSMLAREIALAGRALRTLGLDPGSVWASTLKNVRKPLSPCSALQPQEAFSFRSTPFLNLNRSPIFFATVM